jgi:TetR/AcrR family transcriptional regulator, ethionamide resistance regulator
MDRAGSGDQSRRARGRVPASDARTRILDAARALLTTSRYAEVSVTAILVEAGVAKGSFYFYFGSKEDLLATLVEQAVSGGLDAAESWTATIHDPVLALRDGIAAGARLWRREAPVLRAIVEAAGMDASLDALWRRQMGAFIDAALARLRSDEEATAWLAGRDPIPIVTSLSWLGERVYYLAATDTPPFDDEGTVVDVLTDAWAMALYGRRAPRPG